MEIGVLGSGDVAKTRAARLIKHHHTVTIATRSPARLADLARQNPAARVADFADAAASAELIVLAVKGAATADALQAADVPRAAEDPARPAPLSNLERTPA